MTAVCSLPSISQNLLGLCVRSNRKDVRRFVSLLLLSRNQFSLRRFFNQMHSTFFVHRNKSRNKQLPRGGHDRSALKFSKLGLVARRHSQVLIDRDFFGKRTAAVGF